MVHLGKGSMTRMYHAVRRLVGSTQIAAQEDIVLPQTSK
jgi:hypothetical protein